MRSGTRRSSDPAGDLLNQLHLGKKLIPAFVTEHRFAPKPLPAWRFDFAWPALKIAAEVEGGIWVKGAHTRGAGYEKDCKKYNEAALLGWTVFRFTTGMVSSGLAFDTLARAFEALTDRHETK